MPSSDLRRGQGTAHEAAASTLLPLRPSMATGSACLLIADISGYTGYLAGVELDHAQDILADLMGTIVSALRPGFRLAKLEGDAAFTFAITEKLDGSLLLDTIERCYFGFRRRRRDVRQATSCECNACVRIPDLNLKFVVHHGTILRQRVAGHEELLGSDVILVHRLLKNDVVAATGIEAYALFSQQCVDAMDVDVAALGMRASQRDVRAHRRRARVGPRPRADAGRRRSRERASSSTSASGLPVRHADLGPAAGRLGVRDNAGPTGHWQLGVTGVEVTATGNRRGVGATNHCMHGAGCEHRGAARLASLRLLHVPEHGPDSHGAGPLSRDDRVRADT